MSHSIHTLHCYCILHILFSYFLDLSFHPSLLLSLFAASFYWCLLFPSSLPFLTSTCSPLQNSVLILFRSWLLFFSILRWIFFPKFHAEQYMHVSRRAMQAVLFIKFLFFLSIFTSIFHPYLISTNQFSA